MIKQLTCSYTAYESGKCYQCYQIKSLVVSSKVKYTSTITFLGMYPSQVIWTYIYTSIKNKQKTCIQMFIAAFFIIIQNWKQSKRPRYPTEYLNKMSKNYGISIKHNITQQLRRCTLLIRMIIWANLKIITQNERSQEKRLYIIWFHLFKITANSYLSMRRSDQGLPGVKDQERRDFKAWDYKKSMRKLLRAMHLFISFIWWWFFWYTNISKFIKLFCLNICSSYVNLTSIN